MMTSGRSSTKRLENSSRRSTRRHTGSNPFFVNSRAINSKSDGSSSTTNRRKVPITPHSFQHRSLHFGLNGQFRRQLVEQHPIEAELLYGVGKLRKVHRFDDVAVHAQMVTLDQIPFFARRGQDDDRNIFGARVGLTFL